MSPGHQSLPKASVIVPIRNEARFIEDNLKSLLNQTYPSDRVEILVVDGMSDDGTREKLEALSKKFPQVRRLDNPSKIVASAFNIGICESAGEIILIVGGHTVVAPNYIEEGIRILQERPEVWGSGGPVQPLAKTLFGRAVALAMSHPFGIGNATHRYPKFEGYAFGSAFPFFRKSLFDEVGLYDERLVRNQDDELLLRLQIRGMKNYISPKVQSSYYVRESPAQLFRQYLQYGFWRIPVLIKHKRPASLRQLAPLVFYSLVFLGLSLALIVGRPTVALLLPSIYLSALILGCLSRIRTHGVRVALLAPLAMIIMHFAYAVGMFRGLLVSMRESPFNQAMSELSR